MSKRLPLWLGALAVLIATSLHAQDAQRAEPFEGSVTYLLEARPEGVSAVEASVIRMRMMMQVKGSKATMIMSSNANGLSMRVELLMIDGHQESYMIDHDSRKAKRLPADLPQVAVLNEAKVDSVVRVGSDTALGMPVTVYELVTTVKGVQMKVRRLVYEKVEFPSELLGVHGMSRLPNLHLMRGMPLAVYTEANTPQGKVIVTMRCLEFKLHPVDEATVTLPKGYTVEPFTR